MNADEPALEARAIGMLPSIRMLTHGGSVGDRYRMLRIAAL